MDRNTIRNCWLKTGILPTSYHTTIITGQPKSWHTIIQELINRMNLPDPLDASGNVSHYNISLFLFVLMLPMLFKTTEFIAVDNAENANAALDDDEIIQEVLGCKSAENDSDTENENTNAGIEKFSLNEGEDALKSH